MGARALTTTADYDALRDAGSGSIGVGAGDLPALVLPDFPYGDPWTLFQQKTGRLAREPQNTAMEWGLRLEAAMFPKREAEAGPGVLVLPAHRIYANDSCYGLICSPDLLEVPAAAGAVGEWRAVQDRRGGVKMERDFTAPAGGFDLDAPSHPQLEATDTKVTGARQFRDWDDGPPLSGVLQVTAQCRVLGAQVGRLSYLVLDWPEVVWHEVEWEYDPELGDMLAYAAEKFWRAVQEDRAPTFDARSRATQAAVNRMWAGHEEAEPKELTAVALAAWQERRALAVQKQGIERRMAELETVVKAELGASFVGLGADGEPEVTWAPSERTSVTVKELRRDRPELYAAVEAAGAVKTTESRRLADKRARKKTTMEETADAA